MSDSESFVVINGHKVPSEYADLFISGRTGEQLRRIRVHQPDFSVPKVGA
jgi:pyruvate dehydrogenase complex dehydrogenase (E1) component